MKRFWSKSRPGPKNIRELEGVFNKVVFYEQVKNEKVSTKKLDEIINEAVQVLPKNITVSDVIKSVADFFEVPTADITDRSRKQEVVEPRQIAMYLMRDMLKLSYPPHRRKARQTRPYNRYSRLREDKKRNEPKSGTQPKIMLIKERLYKM